tara:strand:+ start:543 stop:920 length:378 start_codon:yes stop_codon:yes gene_type:complete
MRFKECIIAWDNDTGEIKVGPYPERGHTRHLKASVGAVFSDVHEMNGRQQALKTFVEFATLDVNSGLTVNALHKEFLKIDEYRWLIAPDIQGSEAGPDWFYRMLRKPDESLGEVNDNQDDDDHGA